MQDMGACGNAFGTSMLQDGGLRMTSGDPLGYGPTANGQEAAAACDQGAEQSKLRQGQSAAGVSCQERVDAKAFTGKGGLHRLRQLDREVDRLESLMDKLAELSKEVAGAEMYLAKHRRSNTGYTFLRWRESGGRKRHLSWASAQQRWRMYDGVTRSWYEQLSAETSQVNEQHVEARRRRRVVLRQVSQQERHVLARAIPKK